MFELQHLDHVAITVKEMEASRQWYCDILGMEHQELFSPQLIQLTLPLTAVF